MKRIRLIVAYDGTRYCGWQVQKNGMTIEGVLNNALTGLLKEEITVIGASRTDSGVHALGNVAIFDTNTRIPPEKIALALNQRLPEDIRIQRSEQVVEDWHPRYCDSIKTYEYRILNRKIPNPIERLYSYFTYSNLDVEKMKEAAEYILGEHDFACFCSAGSQVQSTVRQVHTLDIKKENDIISIKISGNGFLYNMVRIIAGTLVQVGMGIKMPKDMETIINSKDRALAGPTAPACGLTLLGIEYMHCSSKNSAVSYATPTGEQNIHLQKIM